MRPIRRLRPLVLERLVRVSEHELQFAGQLAKFLAQLGSHGLPEIPANVADLGFTKYVAIAFALAFGGASRGQIDPGAD